MKSFDVIEQTYGNKLLSGDSFCSCCGSQYFHQMLDRNVGITLAVNDGPLKEVETDYYKIQSFKVGDMYFNVKVRTQ